MSIQVFLKEGFKVKTFDNSGNLVAMLMLSLLKANQVIK